LNVSRVRFHSGFLVVGSFSSLEGWNPRREGWPTEWPQQARQGRTHDLAWWWCDAMPSHPAWQAGVWTDARGGVWFHGSLFAPRPFQISKWVSEVLAAAERDRLDSQLRGLNGIFCGLVFSRATRQVWLFTDGYSVERLYYAREGDRWAASTDPFLLAVQWNTRFSPTALAALLLAGHHAGLALFEGQCQVPAGCSVRLHASGVEVREYFQEPTGALRGRAAIRALDEAHRVFWTRVTDSWIRNGYFLLSGGRDSRVVLKYMLDAGARPTVLTYERVGHGYIPFTTYLLHASRDARIAEQISRAVDLPCRTLVVDTRYPTDRFAELVALNHGGPGHWELLEIGESLGVGEEGVISGFEGDVFATTHASPGDPRSDLAELLVARLGTSNAYERVRQVARATDTLGTLPTLEEVVYALRQRAEISQSADPETRARWAIIRTMGMGRSVPTFHQIRRYRIPCYPYLDSGVRAAYAMIAPCEVSRRRAHLGLIARDPRWGAWPVSSYKLPAAWEYRLSWLLAWRPRRPGPLMPFRASRMECDRALAHTWDQLGGSAEFWRRWSLEPRPRGYYAVSWHLLTCLRLLDAVQVLLRRPWPASVPEASEGEQR
jgi:hypothetical protein